MSPPLRAATGVVALTYLLSGCGSGEPAATTGGDAIPVPTQRVLDNQRFQDPAFKKLMGKGGRVTWSPDLAKKTPAAKP